MRRRHEWEDLSDDDTHAPRVRERPEPASSSGGSRRVARHSWDDDVRAFRGRMREESFSVEEDALEDVLSGEESSASEFEFKPVSPKEEFIDELLHVCLIRVLNARQFCTLCYQIWNAYK